jgi:hypothetical protein
MKAWWIFSLKVSKNLSFFSGCRIKARKMIGQQLEIRTKKNAGSARVG